MVDSPKNDHWQAVVLTDTGVAPGTYNPANITVGADGRITNASSSSVPIPEVVANVAGLSGVSPGVNGQQAIVLDDGFGEEAMYVWNDANADLGAPQFKWRELANTGVIADPPFGFEQEDSIGSAAGNINVGGLIPTTSIIKSVAVNIITPYDGGATITIADNTGFIYVPAASINPAISGLYEVSFAGNIDTLADNSGTTGQIRATIGGAPTVGDATVFITYTNP
jgi:hypothetical protein